MFACLSEKSKSAVNLVSEVLASKSLEFQAVKKDWELEVNGCPKYLFLQEHGTRFGCKSKNASILVDQIDVLIHFCRKNPTCRGLKELLAVLTDPVVEQELFAFSALWYLCVNRMWQKLKCAGTEESIVMLNGYCALANDAQSRDPSIVLTDPATNIWLSQRFNGKYKYIYTFIYI